MPRMRCLQTLIQDFHRKNSELSKDCRCRLLIVINAIEVLDYTGGMPKNREVQEILNFLTSDRTADVPYDLVLIGSERELGPPFVRKTAFTERYLKAKSGLGAQYAQGSEPFEHLFSGSHKDLKFVSMTRPGIDHRGISYVRRREERSGIEFAVPTRENPEYLIGDTPGPGVPSVVRRRLPTNGNGSVGNVCSVYFARPLKPESLLVDKFLPLAITLFVNSLADSLDADVAPQFKGYQKFGLNKDEMDKIWQDHDLGKREKAYKGAEDARYKAIAQSLASFLRGVAEKNNGIKKKFERPDPREPSTCLSFDHVVGSLSRRAGSGDERFGRFEPLKGILIDHIRRNGGTHYTPVWREIRYVLRSNRYSLTVLFAAAQRTALTENNIFDAARRAEAFIRTTVDRVSAVGEQVRGPVVIEQALAVYDQLHVIGEPRYDMELQRLVLRHLAVIGSPCSADVLVRAPQIRAYFDTLRGDKNLNRARKLQLVEAMTEMVKRGLVFRIHPQPGLTPYQNSVKSDKEDAAVHFGEDAKIDSEFRYALHRLVQRLIVQKMGAGPREFISLNSFAPSLYASMPADLPRLTPDAYNFLRTLVASFSQYPDRRKGDPGLESWHFGEAPIVTRVQALRAAMSIIRSTFSVAVVSRFEDYKLLEPRHGNPLHGYFEMYRIQVRWLIRKGFQLSGYDDTDAVDDADTTHLRDYNPRDAGRKKLAAFYRDEIVWLYNECGLICLVQGNLLDAVALLRNALDLNSRIEGEIEGGAHQNRISLNLAVAQIERGKLDAAQERLNAICRTEEQSSAKRGRIWHLAHGYIGLVNQLKGDLDTASEHYKVAITILRAYGDTRACSAFCRHLGDLERARANYNDARKHINEAIGFAEAGGHEDKHKRARLALVKLDMMEDPAKTGEKVRELFARIDSISEYAEVMEMPALRCEAYTIKAGMLLEQGETTLAGKILSQAMSMARRNGMELRLNSAMTAYARVLSMRGMGNQAHQLLFSCLEMAKRHKNQLEIQRIEAEFENAAM